MRRFRSRAAGTTMLVAVFAAGVLVTVVGDAAAAARVVPLGAANRFAVLAGSGLRNTGPTTLTGALGTYPTKTIAGIGAIIGEGANHPGDAVARHAKADLVTAYKTAAGLTPTSTITADLGGQSLSPGVYGSASSIGLTGTLILDAHGDRSARFVFQAGSTLTTAPTSQVRLINGAQACNVYWQVGSSATLGAGSSFRGTVLAGTSIAVNTGASVSGRLLALNGAVTLSTSAIHRSTCGGTVKYARRTTARLVSRHVGHCRIVLGRRVCVVHPAATG